MNSTTQTETYTLVAVNRPNLDRYGFLVVRATWNHKTDTFSFTVDGYTREWHRRGSPMFKTWADGCAYVRSHGWPLA